MLSVLVRVLAGICRTEGDIERARVLAYDLLRELDKPKYSLVFSAAIASVWPEVYKVTPDLEADGAHSR